MRAERLGHKMLGVLNKASIRAKLYLCFGAILLLIVILGMQSFLGATSSKENFGEYRAAARQTIVVSEITGSLLQARVQVMKYRALGDADSQAGVYRELSDMRQRFEHTGELIKDTQVLDSVDRAIGHLDSYEAEFTSAIQLQEQRNGLVKRLNGLGPVIRQRAFEVLELAAGEEGKQAAMMAGRVQQRVMLSRVYAQKFLLGNAPSDAERSKDEGVNAGESLADVLGIVRDPAARASAVALRGDLLQYRQTFSDIEALIAQRNTHYGNMDAIGPEITAALTDAQAALIDLQNRLGPAATARFDQTRNTALLVAVISLATGGFFAWGLAQLVSGPILSLTRATRRLANQELDIQVPYVSRDDEIGQMAQAVDVFKTNALEKRELEEEQRKAEAQHEAERVAAEERVQQERKKTLQRLCDAFAHTVDKVANGDLTARVTEQFDDPNLAQLADTLNAMAATVQEGLRESRDVMAAIAQSDLSKRVVGQYNGEFDQLKRSVNETADILSDVVGRLKAATRTVADAMNPLLDGAGDLANRTTSQAASIEETSAATEQLSNTVKQNAARADKARGSADTAHDIARTGGEVMTDATAAIDRIAQSSAKISDIIGLIDNIAFQTNLLALNASVEAARAGEAGKGFAVVASEVRRLAQSAGAASQEVKGLIDEGAEEVRQGVDLVSKAAESLSSIVVAVGDVTGIMNEIAEESREQALSLNEVNTAIRNLDEMTQRNAVMADETRRALGECSEQITLVDGMANDFVTADGTGGAGYEEDDLAA